MPNPPQKSREEILRLRSAGSLREETSNAFVSKALKLLAPVYGYHPSNVVRVAKACGDKALLQHFKEDAAVGHLIPRSLQIGGITGVAHTDLLSLNITKQRFFRKFIEYTQEFGEVTFVFPVIGSIRPWVMHNLEVSPGRRLHSIMLYARQHGGSHIQLIRIENFIKEFTDEQATEH